MPDNRFYIDSPLSEGELLSLTDSEFHHLSKVMRNEVGDRIELVNGRGTLAKGTIQQIDKHNAEIRIESIEHSKNTLRKIILAQGLLLMHRLELVVEKGTELGASEFWFFPSERSEKMELAPKQLERLKLISIAAMKQSGRLDLPSIEMKKPLKEWTFPSMRSYFGSVDREAPPLIKEALPPNEPLLFFVGPEKGFSPNEKSLLQESSHGISLNPNTLRAETAALCALSILVQI